MTENNISVKTNRCPKINIFIPYYGKFPNYFQLYLDSLGINSDVLSVYFITDIDTSSYNIPINAIIIPMSIESLRKRISIMLMNLFRKTIPSDELLHTIYKLVDFKITYPLLFDDIIKSHGISECDYVGWGDCDVIYGKLSNFINVSENYDIIGGWHGHFTAIKNLDEYKNLFMLIDGIYNLFTDTQIHATDERAYRIPLSEFIKTHKLKLFHMSAYFTDIVPPCFFHLFRQNHESLKKNFFDINQPNKDISYLYYNKTTTKLFTFYDDGEIYETIYCHLQKREMKLLFTDYNDGYYINENSFSINKPIVTNIIDGIDNEYNNNTDDKVTNESNDEPTNESNNELTNESNNELTNESNNEIKIRLHIPAIPHTITRDEYSHCAFTGKVHRFPAMMQSVGFEVYHYGVETSDTNAKKNIILLSKKEWEEQRIKAIKFLKPHMSSDEIIVYLNDPTKFYGDLANWDTPLYKLFNVRFRKELIKNYRSTQTDIVCIPLGHSYDAAIKELNVVTVEIGIGYENSCKDYRIFESYAWLNYTLGIKNMNPPNYWFVIPHSHNIDDFPLSLNPSKKIGFLGRIINEKGCITIVEIAKKFPSIEFILCGQGDPKDFLNLPNITYKLPIWGKERSVYLGSLTALLSPTVYLEPFGAVNTEAQLCGTPVITCDSGGMVETVENFKTGLRCHTLADYCYGVQMALDGKFNRSYIRDRAVKLYDMYKCAKQYEYVFKNVLDIYNDNNGWYSPHTYMENLIKDEL
jgi:glycosyltransferase involved in cell wall biosynthesis